MKYSELSAVAAQQGGLVTWAQTRDFLTRKQLESWLRSGRLQRVRRGVYRFAGAPIGPHDELRSAVLAAGAGAVASHRAAAVLWAMPGVLSQGPELLVPPPLWVRIPGVKCHQSTRLPDVNRSSLYGIAATSPARTIVDLAAPLTVYLLGRITDDSLRRRIMTLDDLRSAYELLYRPGRTHLTPIREVLDDRPKGYRPGDSDPERDLGRILVAAGLPEPAQQYPVPGTPYILDWAYADLRIGMDYDGWAEHGTRSAFDQAAVRSNELALLGWQDLHFTSAQGPTVVVRTVEAARRRALRANTPKAV
jgi:hypothetical protein